MSSTPVPANFEIDEATKIMLGEQEHSQYRSIVGSMMYAMVVTRPDLAIGILHLTKAFAAPTNHHMALAVRMMKYVNGSKNVGIKYESCGQELIGYVDADWGNCKVTRRSVSGYIFIHRSGAISWRAKMQSTVALSSTEAEYISLSAGICEVMWLLELFKELGIEKRTVTLMEDNQSAMKLAELERIDDRSKHFDIKYRHVRDTVRSGLVNLKYIKTEDQLADMMTKGLPKVKFHTLISRLGLVKIEGLKSGVRKIVNPDASRGSVDFVTTWSDLSRFDWGSEPL